VGQHLDGKNLLDGVLEMDEADLLAGTQIDNGNAACSSGNSVDKSNPAEDGRFTHLRQTNECEWTVERQAASEPVQLDE
jgi:hypothetical protein